VRHAPPSGKAPQRRAAEAVIRKGKSLGADALEAPGDIVYDKGTFTGPAPTGGRSTSSNILGRFAALLAVRASAARSTRLIRRSVPCHA